jgi:hypothetical protein
MVLITNVLWQMLLNSYLHISLAMIETYMRSSRSTHKPRWRIAEVG